MHHICGLPYVGIHKTVAVKQVINRHNPDCEVECCEATWDKIKLSAYIASCDLVLDATGNNNFSLYLNKVCFELDQPIVFAAAYRRARVGRVIMRFNGEDPCLECYLAYPGAWANDKYPIIPSDPDEGFIEDGCGSVTEEAVALDVEAVANFSARQVAGFLRNIHEGNNLGLIVNEPLADVDGQVLRSPGMHFWTNRPYMNCSICGR
jgi:molybdopterin/thiamine biosynthesis adenylyltransferase